MHDAGLASERYAITLLQTAEPDGISQESARYRMEQAIKYYAEWGAHLKVNSLKSTHRALLGRGVDAGAQEGISNELF